MKSQVAAPLFAGRLKSRYQAQAVNPISEMRSLMEGIVGNVQIMLLVLTSLIIVVSGVGIFVSIYNSMADRKREIAVMRALGAQRTTVFSIILTESVLLCLGGGVLGLLLGHGLVFCRRSRRGRKKRTVNQSGGLRTARTCALSGFDLAGISGRFCSRNDRLSDRRGEKR